MSLLEQGLSMLRRPFSLLMLTSAACAVAPSAWAQAAVADAPSQAREVRAWLLRIHEASSQRNYEGTFVVSSTAAVASARIAHYCQGPNQFERSESLDGQARFIYRHNDEVRTLWPASKVALIEKRNLLASFPALLQAGDDRIADFYEVRRLKPERIAGHEANVLLVKPRDAFRYGYRLWADQGSGLLLRADVLGEHHEILESSAFSDVTIDVKPKVESVLQPMSKLDGYRVLHSALTPTRLDAEGWTLREPAPGFRLVSCVKRPMDDAAGADVPGAELPVVQAIYSDGLTYVSVFIEPFDAQRHPRAMTASVGATQTLMQRHADSWVTVVGDVPPATLRRFAKGLERKP